MFGKLLPADTYIVVNRTILSNDDRKKITMLYQPIIGHTAVSLYLTLIDDLEKLVMEDPFVKDDRKIRNEVDRLKTITENPRTKTFYSGEYTTKACMALIHEQHEILQQRAEAMDMSTAEYVRYKLSDNMDAVAKMKIIPPLYSLNKVFGNESYPYTNEEEVLS